MSRLLGQGSSQNEAGSTQIIDSTLKKAMRWFKRGEYGKCCAYFCIAFQLDNEKRWESYKFIR